MASGNQLAARLSDLLQVRPGVVERKMFGGIGWMLGGNMAVGVMREDHMVVRLAPEEVEDAIRAPHMHEFGRPGTRPMKGFVLIEPEALADDAVLAEWVERGAARALELPTK